MRGTCAEEYIDRYVLYVPSLDFAGLDSGDWPLTRFLSAMKIDPFLFCMLTCPGLLRLHDVGRDDTPLNAITVTYNKQSHKVGR
jgi:hypothetical protein